MKYTRSFGRMSGASCSAWARSSMPPQTSTHSGRGSFRRALRTIHSDPSVGRADAGRRRRSIAPCFVIAAQRVRRRVAVRVGLQVRVVRGVAVDHLEDVLAPAGAVGRRDQPLDVEHVGVEQEVHHRLEVVGIGAADVGGDDDARPPVVARLLLRASRQAGERQQEQQRQTGEPRIIGCRHRRRGAGTAQRSSFSCVRKIDAGSPRALIDSRPGCSPTRSALTADSRRLGSRPRRWCPR